jgi:hypothetical protein
MCLKLPRLRSGRGAAAALAALCLLSPILGYAHLVLVAHARCAEHGELLHVAANDVESPRVETDDPANEATLFSEQSEETASHDHDHCLATSTRKTDTPVRSKGPALAASEPPPALLVDGRPVAPRPLARYVLAPKNSPPA